MSCPCTKTESVFVAFRRSHTHPPLKPPPTIYAGAMPINIAVLGLGFMGQTHLRAYAAARALGYDCRVVAVADRSPERLTGLSASAGNLAYGVAADRLFDPKTTRTYTDPDELFADPSVDLLSICTHTDTHALYAISALKAGKHVLCEKPIALDPVDVRSVAEAAYRYNRLCMPAMCMRFWPGWSWLKARVDDHTLGNLRSLTLQRLSSPPDWGTDFYRNTARSGGALADLHIHDADFIYHLLGKPEEVTSTGTLMHISTLYRYPESGSRHYPAHVLAEGAQDYAPGFGFKMRYVAAFDRATADFDIARPDPLLLCKDGASDPVDLSNEPPTGYVGQVCHLLEAIAQGRSNDQLRAPIDDAIAVSRLLEAERESIERRRPESVR
jgi:predicted dehydrogenase